MGFVERAKKVGKLMSEIFAGCGGGGKIDEWSFVLMSLRILWKFFTMESSECFV